jgi:hypothetical protein
MALLTSAVLLAQGTWALAGTTGTVQGNITDADTGAPLAGVAVTATSPSQQASTTTDAGGHYAFLSLAPDTYVVTGEKSGYDAASRPGVTVYADQNVTVALAMRKSLRTIAHVTSAAAGALVRPGTTADIYSVNATTAARAAALGGGGALNQAYSAVASVPGVYLPTGAGGWNQTILIRGGDYDQVGYEYDGVPVNRSFDNYPAHTASALGQQEVQVYTGSSPANAESDGLAGFINQVIKTGTYPGFGNADLGIAWPSYFHKASVEAGGASPNRLFSWYVGSGGYNNSIRYIDMQNGASWNVFGPVEWQYECGVLPGVPADQQEACYVNNPAINFAPGAFNAFVTPDGGMVGPGTGLIQGPINVFNSANLTNRDTVVNLHFGIPHKSNAGRDDVQMLYSTSMLNTTIYDSASDWGFTTGPLAPFAQKSFIDFGGAPFGPNGELPTLPSPSSFHYLGAMGQPIPPGPVGNLQPYTFPENPVGGFIPLHQRGGFWNDDSIMKLQYQKNFSSNAYLRLYGYIFYSDWLNNDPNTISPDNGFCCIGQGLIQEYELMTHTRGLSGQFAWQWNPQNLLNVQASTTYSTVTRYNNSGSYFDFGQAAAVSSTAPNSGVCYDVSAFAPGSAAVPSDCFGIAAPSTAVVTVKLQPCLNDTSAAGCSLNGTPGLPNISSMSCGGAPCEWLAVDSGNHGTLNQVAPTFNAYSLTDQFQPINRLLLNLGLRYETFQFKGVNTNTGARPFWFAAYNNAYCASTTPGTPTVAAGFYGAGASTAVCPVAGTVPLNSNPALALTNGPANYFYHVIEPRVSGTFTVNPSNVIRFSYGRYSQPANTAAEQYNEAQENLPSFLGSIFYPYGYHSPGHNIPPEVTNNYDLSWEHQFRGTDLSFKLTPFWRTTQGEQTAFFINPLQAFVSNIPVGNLQSRGVEFALSKGDFNRNGLSGSLAFTYTYTDIKYGKLNNGGTPLSVINNDVAAFNAFTSFCASHGTDPRCLTQGGTTPNDPNTGAPIVASPCYTTAGAPAPACGAGTVANPYWNAPVNALFNLAGPYWPTDTVVATTGLNVNSYAVPYVATLLLNYKHDKFAITPSIQFEAGQRYGVPENTEGVDPATCAGVLPGTVSSTDPRYIGGTGGVAGGSAFDATTCGALIAIPDQFTNNHFDNIAQFVAPSQLLGNVLMTYDISPKLSLQLTFANVFNSCFGGTKTAWTQAFGGRHGACSYTGTASAFVINPVGNFYNPGTPLNKNFQYPYQPFPGVYNPDGALPNQPFSVYADLRIKI